MRGLFSTSARRCTLALQAPKRKGAAFVLTTAHSFKGHEGAYVQLADDYYELSAQHPLGTVNLAQRGVGQGVWRRCVCGCACV